MTWGSSCPQCGKSDCRWSIANQCEGMFDVPTGFRLSVAETDFGDGWYFFIEERYLTPLFRRERWREIDFTQHATPQGAVEKINSRLMIRRAYRATEEARTE